MVKPAAVITVVVVVLLCLGVAAAAGRSTAHRTAAPQVITVGTDGCGRGLGEAHSGRLSYRVRNGGASPEEVTVLDQDHRYAYGALELLAPGTTRTLVVLLPPGSYSFSCEADSGTIGYSDPFKITGRPVSGVHRWLPATYGQLANAVSRYRASVGAGLSRLAADTDRLAAAVKDHDHQLAEQRWLTAHLDYERLGAAYGTFGDFADRIDGRPDGLPNGVHDKDFSGFHRLEYALWHGADADDVRRATDRLDRDVHELVSVFGRQITDPNDVALRTHEVLENTLQFELTGATDQGSHTNLATAKANLDGTRMTLAALTPVLRHNDPALLATATRSLDRLGQVLAADHRGGRWLGLDELSTNGRERLDGTLAQTLEQLAPIPTELEILTTHDDG